MTPGTKLGPYEILESLGEGGMGKVFKARDTRLDRIVAIKVSKQEFSERFEREARAVAALNHPHICTLHDVGPNYLVFEYVDGQPLTGPMPLDQALAYAAQICDALDAAHSRKIVHRDLKPGNILVTKQGIKLLDFGLAKIDKPVAVAEETVTIGLTVKGQILGTLQYMSPEQVDGKEADARSDIFSFGSVLYEMVTGRKAFEGKSAASVLGAVMKGEPAPAPELTGPLEPLLRRCLEKDPDHRWQSAADLKWALENLKPVASAAAPAARAAHSWIPWAVAAALTLALGATAWTLWPKPMAATQSIRFTVDTPHGTSLVFPFFGQAVSPDGRFVVFATRGQSPGTSLWLRPMDSLDARELPGTEDGNGPFWSPDGKSIGFAAGTKLKRIDIQGGAPQVLCEISDAGLGPQRGRAAYEGGSWSRDGVILFSDGSVIRRVQATGGTAIPITTLDTSRIEIGDYFPQFLPDGRTFLYFIRSPYPNVQGIYAAALGGRNGEAAAKTRIIAGADAKAVYAPPFGGSPGYLLWMRQATLVAQRFDPGKLRLEGDPEPVTDSVDSVAVEANIRRAAFWISDTGLLVYLAGSGQAYRMTWVSRDGKQREAVGPENLYEWPRLSPDGRRLAVARTVAENRDIWIYELSQSVTTRLTFDGGDDPPVWSPDGRWIAFSSLRNGTAYIYRKDASGAGREEILKKGGNGAVLDWSRDGRYLLYEEQNPKTGWDLMLLPLDGSHGAPSKPIPFLQTPFDEENGVFSPDGKWIAYDSNESGEPQVYIQAFASSGGKWQVSTAGGSYPRWRGDGKELFYREGGGVGGVMAAGIHTSPDHVDIDTPHLLFQWIGAPTYDAASDGQRFLMLDPPGANLANARPLTLISNWQAGLKK